MFETSLPGHAAHRDDFASAAVSRAADLHRFVAGEENRLPISVVAKLLDDAAWAADRAAGERALLADDDDVPQGGLVLLYGATGTGKSHLVEGLVQQWQARLPGDVVVQLAGSEFAEQYAGAVEKEQIEAFRRRVREADLLVLEDAGKLATKPQAQWELLHTLDALERRGSYVVATLDAPPQKFDTLLPGLIGRFSAGTVVEMSPPSLPSRRTILATIAAERGIRIEPRALELLAADRETTVRELRGTLMRLAAEAVQQETKAAARTLFPLPADAMPHLDAALVRRFLDARGAAGAPTLKQIVEQTARHFGLKAADLKSSSRRRNVVGARDIAIFLARRLTKKSLQEIGEFFGGRDHTTILHSCRKLEAAEEQDPAQRETLAALREKLARA